MKQTVSAGASRRTFILACGAFLAAGATLASIGPLLPFLSIRTGQDIAALGGLFTALSAGVMLAQFGAGWASDRFGQGRVLAAGMLFMGLGGLGVTVGTNLLMLFAIALLAGIGFGAVLAAGNLLVARLFPTRSTTALNGVNLFFGVGSILGPAIAGLAGARLGTPQVALWSGAVLLLALAPAVLMLGTSPSTHADQAQTYRQASQPTMLWLLGLVLLFYTGIEIGFAGWLTVYMVKSAELDPATAALVASGFWLALTGGRAIGAWLGLRLTPHMLLMVSLFGMLAGAALLLVSVGNLERSIAGVLLLGLSCGPFFPTALAIVATVAGGRGTATGLVLTLGNGGGMIIPAVLGWLLNRHGPTPMVGTIFGTGLIMLLFCVATLSMEARTVKAHECHTPS